MQTPIYFTRSGRRRTTQRSTLNWPTQSKFDRVERALPYPSGEMHCKWRKVTTPSGRKMWEPVAHR